MTGPHLWTPPMDPPTIATAELSPLGEALAQSWSCRHCGIIGAVVNMRTYTGPKDDLARIDRPRPWGNPFRIGFHDGVSLTRVEVIVAYADWLDRRLAEEPDFLEPLRGYVLACWCVPEACHGEVILEHLYGSETPRSAPDPTVADPRHDDGPPVRPADPSPAVDDASGQAPSEAPRASDRSPASTGDGDGDNRLRTPPADPDPSTPRQGATDPMTDRPPVQGRP